MSRRFLGSRTRRYTTTLSPCASTRDLLSSHVEAKGENMPVKRIDLPQGTLDLLILRTLAFEPQHGWAISERIQQISSDALQVQQGSLDPALYRQYIARNLLDSLGD